jgi:hydroxyethylthiazole kinase-like uncharacterized protein yjeF
MDEILTVVEMGAADRLAVEEGVASLTLMENAGAAVAEEIARRFEPCTVAVLCGPGNNGGDGFVAARHLAERGWDVRLALVGRRDALKGDAAAMADLWQGGDEPLTPHVFDDANLVIDALFGAGLSRALEGSVKETVLALNHSHIPVVAIDVPSGLHGDLGRALDEVCVEADLTVTFFRKKPAHVLMPGRMKCGEVIAVDIGIPENVLDIIQPRIFQNGPQLWGADFPWPDPMGHKYGRGHCVVVSGPAHATGAARLAARGALRAGAGLVSVASPLDAVDINAASLTAIMVKPFKGAGGLDELLKDKRLNTVVIGPGCGVGRATRELVAAALAHDCASVVDADALTSFAENPSELFRLLHENCVLTPHEGEFERLFPGLLKKSQNRIEAARAAAALAKCTVLLKGADTVIAARNRAVIVNTNAPPTLATAGSGDVLAGFIGGMLAQGLDSHTAAAIAAWLHGEAALSFGPGLIAEDLPELLPDVLSRLKDERDEHGFHPPR